MEKIAKKIKERRLSVGLSMEKVAQKSGIAYRSVHCAEKGQFISVKTLMAICDTLGLEIIIKEKED